MQRVHESDLAGHVLEQGGYDHLCLPAEYEPTTYVTGIGWLDPRTEPDQLLWPERVGPDQIADLKVRLGSYAYAGQFQQRPAPRGGGLFKRSHIFFKINSLQLIKHIPDFTVTNAGALK